MTALASAAALGVPSWQFVTRVCATRARAVVAAVALARLHCASAALMTTFAHVLLSYAGLRHVRVSAGKKREVAMPVPFDRVAPSRHSFCRDRSLIHREALMASNRTVYHVVPDASGDKWLVTQEGSDSMREVFERKAEAVLTAKVRAKSRSRRR